MPHFNQGNMNTLLTEYRRNLREGKARVDFSKPNWVKLSIASALSIKDFDFTTTLFSPRTLERLERFFVVPVAGPEEKEWRKPTVDEFAWAIQNFINRRAQPWQAYVNKVTSETFDDGIPALTDEEEQVQFANPEDAKAMVEVLEAMAKQVPPVRRPSPFKHRQ